MIFNFTSFYNYSQLENSSIVSSSYFTYTPEFEINFSVPATSKLQILQTFELLDQFFQVRPVLKSVKHFGKTVKFNIKLSVKGYNLNNFFSIIHKVRSSSKCKLIKFNFNKSGHFFITFNDFTTLYPFEIKFYDFHTWRNVVSVYANTSENYPFFNTSYTTVNFFHNFFKDIYYGQV
jgi:hypothetical protein